MSEQHLVRTASTFDSVKTELTFDAALRRVGVALVVLLTLAAVWFVATELLVLVFRDAWSIDPRYT